MKLEQKHSVAAAQLVEWRFSGMPQDEIAQKCGVVRKTLYNWRQSTDFIALYEGILHEKISNIEDSPFAHRVDRINELFRLYLKVGEKQTSDIKAKIEILKDIAKETGEGNLDDAEELVALLRRELAEIQGGARFQVHDDDIPERT